MPAEGSQSAAKSIPTKRPSRTSGPAITSNSETTLGLSPFSASPSPSISPPQPSPGNSTATAPSPAHPSAAAARLRRVASTATLRSLRSVRAASISPSITPSSITRVNAPSSASVSTSPVSAGTSAGSASAKALAFSRSKSSHRRRASQGPTSPIPDPEASTRSSQQSQSSAVPSGITLQRPADTDSKADMKRKTPDGDHCGDGITEKDGRQREGDAAQSRARLARPKTWFGLLGGAADRSKQENVEDADVPVTTQEDLSADEAAFRASLGLLSGMGADTTGTGAATSSEAHDDATIDEEVSSAAGTLRALRNSGAEATLTQISKLSRLPLPNRNSWFPWGDNRGGKPADTAAAGDAAQETSASESLDVPSEPASEAAPIVPEPSVEEASSPAAFEAKPSEPDMQATWRWSRWRGQPNTTPSSAHLQEGTESQSQAAESAPAEQSAKEPVSSAAPMSDVADEPQSNSVPYTSYLASWVPSWRGGSVTNSLPIARNREHSAESTTASEPTHGDVSQQRTPAEQVKADALARESNGTGAPGSAISAVVSPSTAVLNSATRSSWVSFFSSRSSNPPPRALLQDGPEVMDIDDEGQGHVASTTAAADPSIKAEEPVKLAYTPRIAKSTSQKAPSATSKSKLPKGLDTPESRPSTPQNDVPKNDPEPPSSRPSTPLTRNQKVARAVMKAAASAPIVNAKGKVVSAPIPNLVLPTFEDTFARPPRSMAPRMSVLERTLAAVNSYLFSATSPTDTARLHQPARKANRSHDGVTLTQTDEGFDQEEAAQRLPRSWQVMGDKDRAAARGCGGVRRIVVIGVHGWFAAGVIKTIMGEPTGTSVKFAGEMAAAVRRHLKEADMELNPEAVTVIPLQGDGKVSDRVNKLFAELLSKPQWVKDLAEADAVFIAAHSQGAVVATHLLARLIEQKQLAARAKIALLSMCGIHQGPFAHLRTTVVPVLNYFETKAATELFEFQSSSSQVSVQYMAALRIVLDAGVKVVYIGSVDDQVVPLYSALNMSCSHPSILRALYIDGNSFPRTDFLINLLVFCASVRNAGLADHDLLTLLSASVAGSLYAGLGHSLLYDEAGVYDLAVRYLFETTHPRSTPTMDSGEARPPALRTEPFTAQLHNPYNLPWAARGLLEDPVVRSVFGSDIGKLLSDYTEWSPVSKTLKDVQWRLEPMRSIKRPAPPPASSKPEGNASTPSGSKL